MAKELPVREPSEYLRRRSNTDAAEKYDRKESLYTEDFYQHIQNIPLEKLKSYQKQARAHFNESKIASLAATIREHGIRQPLTVIPCDEEPGFFEVVSGERRMRAAALINLDRVPCIVIHDHKKAREIALIENLQREDLHPIEEGAAYRGLLDERICLTQEEVATRLGIDRATVVEKLKFSSFPPHVTERLIENNIKTRSSLRKIAACKDNKEMEEVIDKALGNFDEEKVRTLEKRRHSSSLLEVRLSGEKIEVKKGSVAHLNSDLLGVLRELYISLANQLPNAPKTSQEDQDDSA